MGSGVRAAFFVVGFGVLVIGLAVAIGLRVFACRFFTLVIFGALRQALRHDGDFFTRCGQANLGGANRVFAVAKIRNLQGFAERLQGCRVIGALGQHAQGA